MRIFVLPDGMFSLEDIPHIALSESQCRSELMARGIDESIADDLVAAARRFQERR
jgi:hypothetical protein